MLKQSQFQFSIETSVGMVKFLVYTENSFKKMIRRLQRSQ